MSIIVQKFGGTSVATAEKIRHAAQRAVAAKASGHQVVVVVSARGKKTDELVDLANEISDHPSPREMDVLLSTGEQETIALMSMAIHSLGERAVSLTGAQIGIVTDDANTKARIRKISTARMHDLLESGHIVVAAGFQGHDEAGNITTLGRGGSDTTATALAAVLNASLCEIYTDVEGVFTTDPRIVSEARKVPQISYDEMLELASLGAGVMHSRSIEFAKKYQVPLRVRPSFSDGEGTLIAQKPMEPMPVVTGVAWVKEELRVSLKNVPDRPGVMSLIFSKMAARKIPVDLVVQDIADDVGTAEISFTVSRQDFADALTAASEAVQELGQGTITHGTELSKVSIVGNGMMTHTGVAAQMFQTLAQKKINVQMISTGDIKISVLISSQQGIDAVQAIHKTFHLGDQTHYTPSVGQQHSGERDKKLVNEQRQQEVVLSLSNMEDIVVSDVLVDTSQARVTILNLPDRPGIAANVFTAVAEGGIMVDMIVQNVSDEGETNITFTIPRADLDKCLQIVKSAVEIGEEVELSYDAEIAKISVAGIGLRSHTGVGDRMFRALAEQNINILMVGTSEMRMTAIIKQEDASLAEQALMKIFLKSE